jgi:hypothetical protein
MRRRKTGYILLGLLVVTGLAGTFSDTISSKERKFAITLLKAVNSADLKDFQTIEAVQLPAGNSSSAHLSVAACIDHLAASENLLWDMLEKALKHPVNPGQNNLVKLSDEQVLQLAATDALEQFLSRQIQSTSRRFTDKNPAIKEFTETRNEHIKYMKATTEDLRNHLTETPFGWLDSYQLCLLMAAHSNHHAQQLQAIKN